MKTFLALFQDQKRVNFLCDLEGYTLKVAYCPQTLRTHD